MSTKPTATDPACNRQTPSSRRYRWMLAAMIFAVIFTHVRHQTATAQDIVAANDRGSRSIDAIIIELDQFKIDSVADPVDAEAIDGKPVLGVSLEDAALGVEVVRVTDGLAGDRAGLIEGDKIVRIDEADIETPLDAQTALLNHPLGSPLKLVYIRNNREYEREIRFSGTEDAEGQIRQAAAARVVRLEREVAMLRRQMVLMRDAIRILAAEHHHDVTE